MRSAYPRNGLSIALPPASSSKVRTLEGLLVMGCPDTSYHIGEGFRISTVSATPCALSEACDTTECILSGFQVSLYRAALIPIYATLHEDSTASDLHSMTFVIHKADGTTFSGPVVGPACQHPGTEGRLGTKDHIDTLREEDRRILPQDGRSVAQSPYLPAHLPVWEATTHCYPWTDHPYLGHMQLL
ncbi:hypothetical protein GY45DRAFT_1139443 [Cubamyces sp. BRFM 1775]|nr:hypothetical protein GY45DRAFT_1139443 [Cubamyces sp. BRFM 1775]